MSVAHRESSLRQGGGVAVIKRSLLFVDLAGSERILRSGAEGMAAAQACDDPKHVQAVAIPDMCHPEHVGRRWRSTLLSQR